MDLKQLYQDIILEHGKSPRNLGKCEGYNHEAKGYNPLCGDKVHVYLKIDKGKKVDDLTFEGDGCAISLASASIMTELVKGKSFDEAKEIMNAFLDMIKNTSKIQSNYLDEDGVAIRAGHHCCQILHEKLNLAATARASIGIYNTKDDIDMLCKAIENCRKIFDLK